MAVKFGTDGIRGIAYEEITKDVAYKVGNALGAIVDGCKIIVGRDTRVSGEELSSALAQGVAAAGGVALDCGLMPTAGVAYLVRKHGCDFGVVISASHNPPEYNGIKVFDGQGFKASEEIEQRIQDLLERPATGKAGGSVQPFGEGQGEYEDFLVGKGVDLTGMKILLDCSNGASARIAPNVFARLGATVSALNTLENGNKINEDCGAVNAHLLSDVAKGYDVTFAFDGDSDRLIALDERGEIVDGDKNLVIIGRYLKERGELAGNVVVGTTMTNLGIEKAIRNAGVCFERADVGDKYVLRQLIARGGVLGGEGSGHTIILSESSTGDGVQTAVILAKIIKSSGKSLSQLADVAVFPQIIKSVAVKDKERVLGDKTVLEVLKEISERLGGEGRVILRASGTEQKIRVMIESADASLNEKFVNKLTNIVKNIDG